MGHKTGWLTLSSGIAGGADVILIPEIPYDLEIIAKYLLQRRRKGSRFSIIAVAEGAVSQAETGTEDTPKKKKKTKSKSTKDINSKELAQLKEQVQRDQNLENIVDDDADLLYHFVQEPIASRIARKLQERTGIEARVTSLGHVQRGGTPTAFDRWLCTRLGTKAAQLLARGEYNVLIGYDSGLCVPIPLEAVAGQRKAVPPDHPMITSARLVGTCLGDEIPTF
jgi:6-phosphofructokinase 1